MSDAMLLEDLKRIMLAHQGKSNAIPRSDLLRQLHYLGHSLTDRTMRRTYAEVPQIGYAVDGPKRGLFWITSRDEANGVERCQHSKAMATLAREKRIRDAVPAGQMELPL